ncbi:MAG: hypothetical protein ACD_73C00772G0002 [uncultured bacterium]|nr:MAG: hypothetical protein ACD_73C00772G0002 [uncultured bacterium]
MKFTEQEYEIIKNKVVEVEASLSGEIVPVIASQSDDYLEAGFRGSLILAMAAAIQLIILQQFQLVWVPHPLLFLLGLMVVFSYLGHLLVMKSEILKRFFGGSLMERRVFEKANMAFLNHEVFKTEERTGILIYMSLLERRVCVIADSGINKLVAKGVWEAAIDLMVNQIKLGKPVDGLLVGITELGNILKKYGFHKTNADINELSDDLIVKP